MASKKLTTPARGKKSREQEIYKQQIKELRRYIKSLKTVDLRKKIDGATKGKVTKAWKEYQELTTRPYKIYRTKNKGRLKIAQRFAQHNPKTIKFDVAFIPTADKNTKLIFKKDRVIFKSKFADISRMNFDIKKLAVDPAREIKRLLDMFPNATQFVVVVGKSLYNGGLSRSLVEDKVTNLMLQYSPGGQMYQKKGPQSHYENWLFGLEVFQGKSQANVDEYRREYSKSLERAKNDKARVRRERYRKFGQKF